MRFALEARGIGKEYELGSGVLAGGTLYESLVDNVVRSWRKQEPRRRERFWALRDVDFDLAAGEVLGVVGRNGAGKSTLLKVLSRITSPTTGRVTVRGRLASLLEVGTGFHPELTGRENVFLNGVILGMSRREIARKFDEIVAFAELERFLETPVKRYSSGMYVRLAFAVAAHLDADILLVDEVLAVGDAAFQRKSIGKMEEVAGSGRAVVFVSHNLGAVRALCSSVLLLEGGRRAFLGGVEEGLSRYEAGWGIEVVPLDRRAFHGNLKTGVEFTKIETWQHGSQTLVIDPTSEFEVIVRGRAERSFPSLEVNLGFSRDGVRLFSCHDAPRGTSMPEGTFSSRFELPAHLLRPGRWSIGLGAYRQGAEWKWNPEVAVIEVSEKWGGRTDERESGWVTVAFRAERSR